MGDTTSILPLRLEKVFFEIRGKPLIKYISAELTAGPLAVVLGPNGAGKSLLLRICHGLIQPSSGRVVWAGNGGEDPARHQAMVFQRPVLLKRSVATNVAYALKLRGVAREAREPIIDSVLSRTGLRRFAGQPARSLSGGEQQKLALARAWALSPQVLFLDEPTASLDPGATHAVEEIIRAIRDAGTKVVMTTHDLAQARRLADEILFMHRGRLIERRPAEAFFASPHSVEAAAFLAGKILLRMREAAE